MLLPATNTPASVNSVNARQSDVIDGRSEPPRGRQSVTHHKGCDALTGRCAAFEVRFPSLAISGMAGAREHSRTKGTGPFRAARRAGGVEPGVSSSTKN